MVLHRHIFFLALFLIPVVFLAGNKIVWLWHSKKHTGTLYFKGRGNALEQFSAPYSIIYFKLGKDTVWFERQGSLQFKRGDKVPIRYQTGNPSDAEVDNFRCIWGATVIYGGLPLLVLLVIALHPHIIPFHSKIHLTLRKPFIRIV